MNQARVIVRRIYQLNCATDRIDEQARWNDVQLQTARQFSAWDVSEQWYDWILLREMSMPT